jgi:hypothetical protein
VETAVVFESANGEMLTARVVDSEDAEIVTGQEGTARVPPIAIAEILHAAPDLLNAVRGGKVMRLISDPVGPLTQARAGGVLGSVRGEKTIVQNLRFEGGPKDVRVIAAPAAAFQLASAVTMQYYLNTITKQLESLQHGIGDVKEWLRGEELAEVESADQSCADVASYLSAGATLHTADLVKLNDALDVGRQRFAAARTRLEALGADIDKALTSNGEIADRDAFKSALTTATADGPRDFQVLMHAARLRGQALTLLATHEATESPARFQVIEETALREISTMKTTLTELMPMLTRLNIRKSAIKREYTWNPLKWGVEPYRELEQFRTATKELRAHLRAPVEKVVPALVASRQWVIEARQAADGSIETRVQQLESRTLR